MMRSLFSGVSGLKSHQTRMDVIGNNIANVNTTGFKESRVNFEDMLSQTQSGASAATDNVGGTNPKQIGLGTSVGSIDLLFTDGSVQSTGKNTDLALSGNGLFVVKNGNQTYYTRDGAFSFDADGNYVLPSSGMYVQGWMGTNGSVNTNGAVTNIKIPSGKSMDAKATETVTYSNNLNAAAATIQSMTVLDSKGNSIKVNSTDTSDWGVGTNHNMTIDTEDVTFSNGISISGASGKYTMGKQYALATDSTVKVELRNGDTLNLTASTANLPSMTKRYTVGSNVAASITTLANTTTGANVTFEDTGTISNSSNTYTVTLSNKDTISVATSPTAAATFTKGSALSGLTITGVKANPGGTQQVTLSDGSILTNNSNTTYKFTLGNNDVLSVSPNSTATYTSGQALPSGVTVTDINGTLVTLSDGSTIKATSATVGKYTKGQQLNAVSGIGNATIQSTVPTSSITKIEGADNAISSISGSISDDEGNSETFTTNTNGDYLIPQSGLTTSDILLTTSDGNTVTVSSSDNYPYKRGETYNATASSMVLNMSDGSNLTETSGTYRTGYSMPVTTSVTAYDTLGNAHQVMLYFTKTKTSSETGNQWTVSVNTDGSGKYTMADGTTVSMNDVRLQFNTDGKYTSGLGTTTLTLTNGAGQTQNITVDLSSLTQYAGNSTVNGSSDGNAAGTLSSISIDKSGVITGTYTNGVKQTEAQVAVAQFTNASGLEKTGNSLYQVSNNSGTANVKTAADLGVKITPSALEMSNVDIADEFSNMIITQRGFQSNSKIITVGDEMLETLINMKR